MAEAQISSDRQKEILETQMEQFIPSSLLALAHQEISIIAEEIRIRLEKVDLEALNDPNKYSESIAYDLERWTRGKLFMFAHARYQNVMRGCGKNPHNAIYFAAPFRSSPSPYSRWRIIEEKGLKIGGKVLFDGNEYEVTGISPECYLVIQEDNGTRKPGLFSPSKVDPVV
jgi:hypothetical protein